MLKPASGWHEAFLARLTKRLSIEPSTALNPQCLSEQTLYGILDDLEADGFRLRDTKGRITAWLQETGLLKAIPVDHAREKPSARTRFYSFDVATSASSQTSPLELLQAYHSNGAICYFTAIAFHSLSTQPPVHHHIAIPTENYVRSTVPKETKHRVATSRNPLGTLLFSYDGTPFYKTSREERLLPGVQLRYIGPTAVIRITNLEQTLLDTLHRPLACGGPRVVFEAWDRGLKRMDEDRLADFLVRMDRRAIAQRLGYILDDLDYKPRSKLRSVLDQYLSQLNPADSSVYQQLFPGVEYSNLRHPWLVYGP
jgi:predicted transcriptional regulator of viral defense system